jgi:hypothetical protein
MTRTWKETSRELFREEPPRDTPSSAVSYPIGQQGIFGVLSSFPVVRWKEQADTCRPVFFARVPRTLGTSKMDAPLVHYTFPIRAGTNCCNRIVLTLNGI